jgi:multidrug efflux pump subunit AcrA (membrane-fusion protein)
MWIPKVALHRPYTFIAPALLILIASLVGCRKQAAQPAVPPSVEHVTVEDRLATLTDQLPGRVSAYETSEVRPQVNGLVEARLFTEGDLVHKGQPLYRIDASLYEAQIANGQAALARARAVLSASAALARRDGELEVGAVSKQDNENAQSSAAQAEADVATQEAALRTAQIDLARTTILAPITGRNLAALRILESEAQQQREATASTEESLQLSANRYEHGVDNCLQVITAQTVLLRNQRNDIDIERRRMGASVLLVKAVAGGWDAPQLPKF